MPFSKSNKYFPFLQLCVLVFKILDSVNPTFSFHFSKIRSRYFFALDASPCNSRAKVSPEDTFLRAKTISHFCYGSICSALRLVTPFLDGFVFPVPVFVLLFLFLCVCFLVFRKLSMGIGSKDPSHAFFDVTCPSAFLLTAKTFFPLSDRP